MPVEIVLRKLKVLVGNAIRNWAARHPVSEATIHSDTNGMLLVRIYPPVLCDLEPSVVPVSRFRRVLSAELKKKNLSASVMGLGVGDIQGLLGKVHGHIDKTPTSMRQAVGYDGLEFLRHVAAQGVAHLNGPTKL